MMEVLCLILWLLCSVVCYFIMKSKGYPNNTCLKHGIGGFFLGLIWVIVVLCKRDYAQQPVSAQPVIPSNVSQNHTTDDSQMLWMEQLGKLSELKDAGIITEEEFAQKKAEILKKI